MGWPPSGVEGPAHRADHEVVLVERYGAGTGAGHLDDEAGAGQLALQLVAQVEGEAERVEAGTQVRGGRRDTDPGHTGHHRSPAASAAAVTSGSTTDSTSGPNPSSAVAVSLRPWPVTVTTTVLPA